MKVFALGGYGKTAVPAVKLLAQNDMVSKITIAGRNLERGKKLAAELGQKVTAVQVDATDVQRITALLNDNSFDIVMNVAFFDTVLPTIQGCIETGTHYCDAATFGDAVTKTLQLTPQAKEAGITAVVAAGVSPCISNLMGVYASNQLDEVKQLQIGRADIYNFQTGHELIPTQWTNDPQENLSAFQEFKSFFTWTLQKIQENGSRPVCVYQNGQWVEIDPMKEGWLVPRTKGNPSIAYPYYSGEDNWGSLPHDISSGPPVEVGHTPFPHRLDHLLRDLSMRILAGAIKAETAVDNFYTTINQNPQKWLKSQVDFVAPIKMWVNAVGSKNERAAQSKCWLTAPMWNVGGYFLTSVALAVSVLKILRGEVHKSGVIAAEKAFDPQLFFDEAC